MKRAVPLFFVLAAIMGCTSTRASVPPPSPIAAEYRETQAEIQQQQAELAITGARIEEGGRGIVEGIAALETALEAPDFDREQVITRIREVRVIAEDHQSEIETLNLLLSRERETTRRQGELFDRQEEAWQKALSEREAENAALRVENKAVQGQRNAFLAILITAGGVAVLCIVIKVLRALKIIPF
jgi:chromosome segregation ATPase